MVFLRHRSRYAAETVTTNLGVSTLWRVFDVGGVSTSFPDHSNRRGFSSLCV